MTPGLVLAQTSEAVLCAVCGSISQKPHTLLFSDEARPCALAEDYHYM